MILMCFFTGAVCIALGIIVFFADQLCYEKLASFAGVDTNNVKGQVVEELSKYI